MAGERRRRRSPSAIKSPTDAVTGELYPAGAYPWLVANRPIRSIPDRAAAKAVTMMADRVLVRRPDEEAERRSKGGLLIPATAATVSKRGLWATAVAVGPNVRSVEPEDEVLLLPDAGIEVEIGGEEYLLVREREIHAVASERGDPRTGLYL